MTTDNTVLIVDDDDIMLGTIKRVLRKEPFSLLVAHSGEQALEMLETNAIDVLVFGDRMQTSAGTELLEQAASDHPDVVRIAMTPDAPTIESQRSINEGQVYRFLSKPVEANLLAETISDGLVFRQQLVASELWDVDANLPNEPALVDYIDRARSVGADGFQHALFLFGIDRHRDFDAFMHQSAQDKVFRAIGERLLEESDHTIDLVPQDVSIDFFSPQSQDSLKGRSVFVARPGFNEFAVVFEPTDACDPRAVAEALLRTLDSAFEVEGRTIYLSSRCGVVADVSAHDSAYDALVTARVALSDARSRTSERRVVVSSGTSGVLAPRGNIESDFQDAVESGLLDVFYQPVVVPANGAIIGTEALLRWHHPHYGWLNPKRILAIAEERGLMHRLTMQVLGTACRQHVCWRDRGHRVRMSVNIASSECDHSKFVSHVLRTAERAGMEPEWLQLEITEDILLVDAERKLAMLDQLRTVGIKLALDDFGIGYSSLSFLQRLRPDTLKLDRAFVLRARRDPDTACVLECVVRLASRLNIDLVVEGVETAADQQYFTTLGVQALQGYLFGRPSRAADVEPMLFREPLGREAG